MARRSLRTRMASKYSVEPPVPKELPSVLKAYIREVLRSQPDDLYRFGAEYFAALRKQEAEVTGSACKARRKESFQLELEAVRIFELADLNMDGRLDIDEITAMSGFSAMAERLLGCADVDLSGDVDLGEWLEYIRGKGHKAKMTLQLYENVMAEKFTNTSPAAKGMRKAPSETDFLREEATRIFNLGDLDNDGILDIDELTAMAGFRPMAERLLGSADTDLSGGVSLGEWVAYIKAKGDKAQVTLQLYENCLTKAYDWAAAPPDRVEEEAVRVFKLADVNQDGVLNIDELTAMSGFRQMAERLLGSADVDLSGEVDLDEWCKCIKSKGEKAKATLQLYENCLTKHYEWAEAEE